MATVSAIVLAAGVLIWWFGSLRDQSTAQDNAQSSSSLLLTTTENSAGRVGEKDRAEAPGTHAQNDYPQGGAERTGVLKLISDPPEALVFIDEERRGATPLALKDIPIDKEVSIRIEHEGYRPWIQKMSIDGKERLREIRAGLIKEKTCPEGSGWIYVTTVPGGATVELDGKRLPGKTPMIINEVCSGSDQEIRIQAAGYRTWRSTVATEPGMVSNINVELER